MTARQLLGKSLAQTTKADLARRVAVLAERGVVPGLATVLVGDDPGSRTYVAGKHRDCAEVGIASFPVEFPADVTPARLDAELERLNADPACTGYLVQLPLPPQLDQNAVLARVAPDKDVDGLHPTNLGRLALGLPGTLPCTPRGIVALLRAHDVELAGARVCVVGRGTTVGRPLALLLSSAGVDATVTVCHTGTRDLARHTREADVVVAAAGRAGLITAEMVRPGAVLVAVGITRTEQGPVGDFDAEAVASAAAVVPVPGGVGPLTRAMILTNVVEGAERAAGLVPPAAGQTVPVG